MANQAAKKEQKQNEESRKIRRIVIFSVTAFYILLALYFTFISNKEYTKGDGFGFIILCLINYGLNELITLFKDSYFYSTIVDLLGVNLAVLALVQFHWKFWFLYLIVPAYLLYLGGGKLFEYVKTIGKQDNTEQIEEPNTPDKKKKQKIINVKHK